MCACALRPSDLWPARLLCPWEFSGKITPVGCHTISSSRRSYQSRDWAWVSCIGRQILYYLAFGEGILCIVDVVQLLNHVQLFATPWTTARQSSMPFTVSWSLLKLMSIELMMPSNHLVLCYPRLLLPSIFPSIRVFSNELALCQSIGASASVLPMNIQSLVSFRIDSFDLLAVQDIATI